MGNQHCRVLEYQMLSKSGTNIDHRMTLRRLRRSSGLLPSSSRPLPEVPEGKEEEQEDDNSQPRSNDGSSCSSNGGGSSGGSSNGGGGRSDSSRRSSYSSRRSSYSSRPTTTTATATARRKSSSSPLSLALTSSDESKHRRRLSLSPLQIAYGQQQQGANSPSNKSPSHRTATATSTTTGHVSPTITCHPSQRPTATPTAYSPKRVGTTTTTTTSAVRPQSQQQQPQRSPQLSQKQRKQSQQQPHRPARRQSLTKQQHHRHHQQQQQKKPHHRRSSSGGALTVVTANSLLTSHSLISPNSSSSSSTSPHSSSGRGRRGSAKTTVNHHFINESDDFVLVNKSATNVVEESKTQAYPSVSRRSSGNSPEYQKQSSSSPPSIPVPESQFSSDKEAFYSFRQEGKRAIQIATLADQQLRADDLGGALGLYNKALTLFMALTKSIAEYVNAARSPSSNSKTAFQGIRKLLPSLVQRFDFYVKKAKSVRTMIDPRIQAVCPEKLIYDAALTLARGAAVDEVLNNHQEAWFKYRRAFRFLQLLHIDKAKGVDEHDSLILERYMRQFFSRIKTLENGNNL